jgi:hypothetical protein
MPWLVQSELAAAREFECRGQPPPFFVDASAELDALPLQVLDGCVDVITHQVQLVMRRPVRRVRRQLGGRKREDRPATAGINGREVERVAEETANSACVLTKMIAWTPLITARQA